MNERLENGIYIDRVEHDVRIVESIPREDTRIFNAFKLCVNMWGMQTPQNSSTLNPYFDRLWRLTPFRLEKFVDVIRHPITARNIVTGLGGEAAAFLCTMIKYDVEETDDIFLQDCVKPDCTHCVSLAMQDTKGAWQYLHGVPWDLMTLPILFQRVPKVFRFGGWRNKDGSTNMAEGEITSAWIRTFGSLNEYVKNTEQARKDIEAQYAQKRA